MAWLYSFLLQRITLYSQMNLTWRYVAVDLLTYGMIYAAVQETDTGKNRKLIVGPHCFQEEPIRRSFLLTG